MMNSKLLKLARMVMNLAQIKTNKGELISETVIKVGSEVFIEDANDMLVAAPDGEYVTQDEVTIVVGNQQRSNLNNLQKNLQQKNQNNLLKKLQLKMKKMLKLLSFKHKLKNLTILQLKKMKKLADLKQNWKNLMLNLLKNN